MASEDRNRKGPETWLLLRPQILSESGKEIVSEDPNLTPDTMQMLLEAYNNEISDVIFYFGLDDESDIGLTVISMCIQENLDASFAELVARYADTRGTPFLETAIALHKLRREEGLYVHSRKDNIPGVRMWFPNTGTYYKKPPKKRIS